MWSWKSILFAIIRASDAGPDSCFNYWTRHNMWDQVIASQKRWYDTQGKDQRKFDVFLFFYYITMLCIQEVSTPRNILENE